MISLLKKVRQAVGLSAIEFSPEGVAYSHILDATKSPALGKACGFYPCDSMDMWQRCLNAIVDENNLYNQDCNWVLHPSQYRLLLIDAPKVPQSEYKSALKWQIKDMVDYPLDDLVVDIFNPGREAANAAKKIYLIATKQSFLQGAVEIIERCQLNLIAIDIPELTLRNLVNVIAENSEITGYLHLYEKLSIFLLVKNKNIVLARHIEQGYQAASEENSFAELVNEIKRSFEYCQNQLKQPLPKDLYLSSASNQTSLLPNRLAEALLINVSSVDLNKYITFSDPLDQDILHKSLIALTGALREVK